MRHSPIIRTISFAWSAAATLLACMTCQWASWYFWPIKHRKPANNLWDMFSLLLMTRIVTKNETTAHTAKIINAIPNVFIIDNFLFWFTITICDYKSMLVCRPWGLFSLSLYLSPLIWFWRAVILSSGNLFSPIDSRFKFFNFTTKPSWFTSLIWLNSSFREVKFGKSDNRERSDIFQITKKPSLAGESFCNQVLLLDYMISS